MVGAEKEIAGKIKHDEVRDMSALPGGATLAISIKGSNLCMHHLSINGRVTVIKHKGMPFTVKL